MNKNIFMAAAAVSVLLTGMAYAQSNETTIKNRTAGDIAAEQSTASEFSESLKDAAKKSGDVLKGVGETAKSAALELKADIFGEDGQPSSVKFENRMTAKGMIGQDVLDTRNAKVATVKDIILDKDGTAQMVVVADGGFLGFGDKLAAFDYASVITQTADGDVIMPLGPDTVKNAAGFAYKADPSGDKTLVMPVGSYSASKLMDGNLLDQQGRKAAKIENIAFRDGGHARVIVAYDQTLGMGGQLAAFDFKTLKPVRKDSTTTNLMMGAAQSASFEKFKKQNTKK